MWFSGAIADIQYADVDSPPQGRCYRQSAAKLEKCVQYFNSCKPDFVIQLGDLIDHDTANYEKILSISKKLKMPLYHVIGNHDAAALPDLGKLTKVLGMPARYYDFACKGWRFIVLDTTGTTYKGAQALYVKLQNKGAVNAQPWNGGVDPEQIAWLKRCLEKARKANEKVIVFGHMPLYPVNVHNLWNDGELVEILEKENVRAYFNGHNHAGNFGEKKGIYYINLAGMVETPDQTAAARVELYPDHLKITGIGREISRNLKFTPNDAPHRNGSTTQTAISK